MGQRRLVLSKSLYSCKVGVVMQNNRKIASWLATRQCLCIKIKTEEFSYSGNFAISVILFLSKRSDKQLSFCLETRNSILIFSLLCYGLV